MSLIKDLLGIFKKNSIVFQHKIQENDSVVSFLFTSEDKIKWIPGQHAGFTIDKNKAEGKPVRPFSIASTPDEDVIRVTMRVTENPSAYKKYLMSLKSGDKIIMSDPIGSFFVTDNSKPALLIAGGIGITPYRALLKYYAKAPAEAPKSVKLLYHHDCGEFIFKDEFDEIQDSNELVSIKYIVDRDVLMEEIKEFVTENRNNAYYFISGAPVMIYHIKKVLKDSGIKNKMIKNDPFRGY